MVKNLVRFLGIGLSALSLSVYAVDANYSVEDIPQLAPESQHEVASKRISSYFTRYHYGRAELTQEMGEQIFDRYVEQLDYNKMFLLQTDIEQFSDQRSQFNRFVEKGELAVAFEMYQLHLERRMQRYEYALSLLDETFSFDQEDERFYYDREDASWATSEEELNEIWDKRVRSDAINLALAGRSEEEIKDNLTRRYQTALQRIVQAESEDAFQTVMNAFARSVDAHTSYLSPRNAERFQQNMNLSLEGIGAVLQAEYDYTVIRSLVPGGPADRSGEISPEDKIIAVAQGDQEFVDVIGWRLDDVVELITGPKGSVVRLQILSGSQGSAATPKTVEITREEIRLEDREAKLEIKTDDNQSTVGVIEIPAFYNNLSGDVRELIAEANESNVEGLVIDLRGNGGGALNEAIYLTGLFIDSGPVVQVRDSAGRVDVSEDPDPSIVYDGPLVVMVDRYSASASEIFAAAIQDYGRGVIVGEQTFGKGTVQQHRGLQRRFDFYSEPMGSVQYTIAKFYRVNGGSTQHKGVVPDIAFPTPVDPEEFGESQADNALPWDQIDSTEYQRLNFFNSEILNQLASAHESRINEDPEFVYVLEDIERYKEAEEQNYVSLVLEERQAETEENKERRLARANERMQRDGLEPVDDIDDVPEQYFETDPYLQETVSIVRDYIRLLEANS
ncbi:MULTISPECIES: carboxy terminal-processing peptidase [Gammaproteobacteria]|uniref:carboxy terminal-processing peptidase n=1 Tax=Gammaproteobacteria TaxID=1236 RepID=UPI000DD00752|nr:MULTISPECIES: carboxy terminal-processing peptidase [Gammaproteobacteria]RTE87211.1 carboxy terminal-processing peptidase [Aliidiomarina sp. B3213]TCZ93001.1 carboxy terminal-processing peptidase [Lysobacter sp. N42]